MSEEGKTLTEILPELAAEAERNPDGWWAAFESSSSEDNVWANFQGLVLFASHKYRRKPKTVKRTIEYPEPLKRKPNVGEKVFVASISEHLFYGTVHWNGDDFRHHHEYLARGLLHATKEAAIAHGKALAGESEKKA